MAERASEDDETTVIDLAEEIPNVRRWLTLEQFDRRKVNQRLLQYARGDRKWLFAQCLGGAE